MCCVRVWWVINLQLGVAVGIMLLHSEAFHDASPHPHHPEPPGPSFILIYELPHGHSALLYHLCIDPSRSTRCSTAAQIDIEEGLVCVSTEIVAASQSISVCPVQEGVNL